MIQKLFTQLVASLYSTLARTYDLLLNYASDATVIFEESSVESITSSLYTLLGIFMVFRIGITLLTYLIDPDKVSDKSVGVGKLLTRVFTSIVLILTMNTFIFPLLNKLQDALLGSDSIINRLLIEEVDAAPSNCSINVGSTKHFVNCDVTSGSYNIENVKSDITNEIYKFLNNYQYRGLSWTELPRESTNVACSNCIIYNVNYVNTEDVDKGHISNVTVKMINPSVEVVNSYQYGYDSMDFNSWPKYYTTSYEAESSSPITQEYSLPFLSNGTSGEITASFAVTINVNVTEEQSTHRECYYHYYGEYKIYDENDPTKVIESKHGASPYIIKIIYSKNENFDGANMGWGVDWKINSEKCPGENCFDFSKPSVNANNYSFSANNASVKTLNDTGSCPKTISNITCDIKSKTCSLTDNAKISNSKLSGTKTGLTDGQLTYEEALNVSYEEISEAGTGEDFGLSFLSEAVDPKALEFAVNVLRSFTSPSSEITSEFLTDPGVTTAISNKVADGKIRMDTLILLIAGIVLIVLLLTICIEVIVRNMKLLLLQIISPIAIMSYMNPNDKIFSQWVKMYLSTYANLFIQLFIINVGLYFLPMFIKNAGGLRNILIYGGVFIFIKTAPGMISKVLGLDASGGTFKDSLGLVKAGLGIGAGTAAGALAAGSVFAHGGSIGNAFRAFGAGVSGGSKWNFKDMNSTKKEGIKAANARKASGQSWWSAEKDALKFHIPFVKTDADYAEAAKGASNSYQSLDSALTGALYSEDKRYEEMDKLLKGSDNAGKIEAAADFGVDTSSDEWKNADNGRKLAMIRSAWGTEVDNARARILYTALSNVREGKGTAFDMNIVNLASSLDSAESYTKAKSSGVSNIEIQLTENDTRGLSDEQIKELRNKKGAEEAAKRLDKAKKHNKSGYTSSNV